MKKINLVLLALSFLGIFTGLEAMNNGSDAPVVSAIQRSENRRNAIEQRAAGIREEEFQRRESRRAAKEESGIGAAKSSDVECHYTGASWEDVGLVLR